MNENEILQTAIAAARQGRQVLLDYFGQLTQVSEKAHAGLVSEADLESERIISQYLREYSHEYAILGEESSFQNPDLSLSKPAKGGRWVVDPLDGTTNYVHRFPIFCISIGFEWQGEAHVGVVDVPVLDHTYTAIKGRGAWKNGSSIHVSECKQLKDSLLATGFFADNKPALAEQLKIFSKLVSEARGVRRAGAAAYDLCLVAEGVFDAFWEKNLQPWDTSAGSLLVQEAGGCVTDYLGGSFSAYGHSILASNGHLHAQVHQHLQKALSLSGL